MVASFADASGNGRRAREIAGGFRRAPGCDHSSCGSGRVGNSSRALTFRERARQFARLDCRRRYLENVSAR